MTPERHQRIGELFHVALGLAERERAAFLDRACEGDSELRREVESLVGAHQGVGGVIDRPALEVAAELLAHEGDGEVVGGMVAGRYRVLSLLGTGGMGQVYLAEDAQLRRKVALKLLSPGFVGDTEPRARFLREARLASALDHPNVCTVHEVGEDGGRLFIAMQYVEGETLRDVIGGRPLALDLLLSIGLQVAGALAAAHARGIIHRDVKAGNIIVTPEGQAKVLDFGLAKLLDTAEREAETHLTMTGAVMGTPAAMSPEQARGEHVDQRSDIFSFGVVLYEMATGQIPFKGKSKAEVVSALLKDAHISPAELNKEVPARLSALIDRSLAKEPGERYQSMTELLAEMRRVVAEAGGLDHLFSSGGARVGEVTPYVRPPRRPSLPGGLGRVINRVPIVRAVPAPAVVIGIALLCLLAGAIGLSYFATNQNRADSGAPGKKSIAVLPLKPVNTANRDELYEIGVADSLIHSLSSIKGFVVRPLSATRKYAAIEQDPIAAGREQQVNYVLASNYQLAGGKIRITAQLFNVGNGQIEETYKSEKDASDLFAMQDAVGRDVGRLLQARFAVTSGTPGVKRGTDNEEAYRLYLQGMYIVDIHSLSTSQKAVEVFERAVELDPDYAQAWAGKAHAHRGVANFIGRNGSVQEDYQKSMEAIKRALSLDENLAEAYSTLCENKMYYEYDFVGAESACKRGIELNPNSPVAHQVYSRYLISRGRYDEAISEIKTTIDLEPASLFYNSLYGINLYYARRYPEAIAQFKRVIAMDENYGLPYYWLCVTLQAQGNELEAYELFIKNLVVYEANEASVHAFQTAYQSSGWRGIMLELAKRFEQNEERYFFGAYYNAQAGNNDKAFEYLEKSYQRREMWMAYLQVDPRLGPLRDDPRFDELVRRVELRAV